MKSEDGIWGVCPTVEKDMVLATVSKWLVTVAELGENQCGLAEAGDQCPGTCSLNAERWRPIGARAMCEMAERQKCK